VHHRAYRELPSEALEEFDILAEQFPPLADSKVPLLKEGVVLTTHFIAKLLSQSDATMSAEKAKIFRPSSLARYFSKLP
jgi:hypothetical protein